METRTIGTEFQIDIMDVTEFKSYYDSHKNSLTGYAFNAFLKALDIPPRFFKEQPEETQEELLDNREVFVRESNKFFNKTLIVLRDLKGNALNACKMDTKAFEEVYESLTSINDIDNKFIHRTFSKDGYASFVIYKDDIKKETENKVLVLDFPILPNKTPVIHKALFTPMPTEAMVDHIQYLSSEDIVLTGDNKNYNNIAEAVNDFTSHFDTELEAPTENGLILVEPEILSLALVEFNTIPKSYRNKVEGYIEDSLETEELSELKLTSLLLDYDSTFTTHKQVTNLRCFNVKDFQTFLNSKKFEVLKEEAEELEEELVF